MAKIVSISPYGDNMLVVTDDGKTHIHNTKTNEVTPLKLKNFHTTGRLTDIDNLQEEKNEYEGLADIANNLQEK